MGTPIARHRQVDQSSPQPKAPMNSSTKRAVPVNVSVTVCQPPP